MPIIPNDEQFIGTSSDVDMSEKKSSQVNSKTQVYTLQDFKDSLGPGVSDGTLQIEGGVALDGTLRKVSDQGGNLSPLQLSTGIVSSNGTGGTSSLAYGTDQARGTNSTVFGAGNAYAESFAVAVGRDARADQSSTTLGEGAQSLAQNAVSIGRNASSTQNGSISIGRTALASDSNAISIGYDSDATALDSIALGNGTQATFNDAMAIGRVANAQGDSAISFGVNTNASGTNSIALGKSNVASGNSSIAIGPSSDATQTDAIAIGNGAQATATGAVAMGNHTAPSDYSTILGGDNNVIGTVSEYSSIIGGRDNQLGQQDDYSIALGGQNNVMSNNSQHSVMLGGKDNVVNGGYSFVGGNSSEATNSYAFAFGQNVNVSGNRSVGIGHSNNVSGGEAVSLGGQGGSATGSRSFRMPGLGNNAAGDYSISHGNRTVASLYGQLAYGAPTFASESQVAQMSSLLAIKSDDLTTGGTTVLSLDGTGTTNLIIPSGNNRVWNVVASWSAIVTGTSGTTTGVNVGDVITQSNAFAFKKIGVTSSIVGSVTDLATHSDSGMSSASMGYSAGASQELALTFTAPTFSGGGSVTLRIVNKIMLTEVAY